MSINLGAAMVCEFPDAGEVINKRTDDYTSSRKFRVGNSGGGTFAFFAVTLSDSSQSIPVQQSVDRVYRNPI